jgi:hypothetical protein
LQRQGWRAKSRSSDPAGFVRGIASWMMCCDAMSWRSGRVASVCSHSCCQLQSRTCGHLSLRASRRLHRLFSIAGDNDRRATPDARTLPRTQRPDSRSSRTTREESGRPPWAFCLEPLLAGD